jgi:uncharacterized protein YndB with AHSA1/START domain
MTVEAARVETRIDAPPDKVWAALTDKEKLRQFFFGSDIETDWRVGSPIFFRGDWKGQKYEDKGVIRTVDRAKKLSFTHFSALSNIPDRPENYHIVTFDLRPAGGGTEVVLIQENQNESEPRTPQVKEELKKNWSMLLDGLKKVVED